MANRMTESYVMVESYIRGYHVYKDAAGWDPQLNEERALKREPKNIKDVNAVAVVRPNLEDCSLETTAKEHANTVSGFDEILGHIPLRMAEFVTKFLKRGTNKGKAIITVNLSIEELGTAWKFLVNTFFMVMLKHLYRGSSPSLIIWDTVFGTISD